MIPQRILLKGFLSYRDERELRFDGGSLWMLAGPNGSGKSGVFDAVTYALFGYHRGGKQNARELVNKDSDGLVVEFEFSLEGRVYQVRRTLRKASGRVTRQISLQTDSGWEAVPDTSREAGFAAWIGAHVGLTYETFTSSVLLLQGKAEKLLAADPVERFNVLASIVDLGRYQRLHEGALARRREWEAAVQALQQQLDALPEPAAEDFAGAEARAADASTARDRVRADIERLRILESEAKRHADLRHRLDELVSQARKAEAILSQAEIIERDWRRFADLRLALPHLDTILTARTRLAESLELTEELDRQSRELSERLDGLSRILNGARQEREAIRSEVASAEARQVGLSSRLREVAQSLGRAESWERQKMELERMELECAGLPPQPETGVEGARRTRDQLAELARLLPRLRHLESLRLVREQARRTADEALRRESAAARKLEGLAEVFAAKAPELESLGRQYQQARDEAIAARTRFVEAEEEVGHFRALAGAARCPHCGQPLTPGHLEMEMARREKEDRLARERLDEAEGRCTDASRRYECLFREKAEIEQKLEGAREELRGLERDRHRAELEAKQQESERERAYQEVREGHTGLIGEIEWNGDLTSAPTSASLLAIEQQIEELPAAESRLAEAQALCQRHGELCVRIDILRQALAAEHAEFPVGLESLRGEHSRLVEEEAALRERINVGRQRANVLERSIERLGEERQSLTEERAGRVRRIEEQASRRCEWQETVARARAFLSAAWQSAADSATPEALQMWHADFASLELSEIETRSQKLQAARVGLETVRQQSAALEHELETISLEARRSPEEIADLVVVACHELTEREEALDRARDQLRRLEERRETRQTLQEQFRRADRQATLYRTLADGLGRKGLQRHLIRRAEEGIVDFANGVLDRLSSGRFYLRTQTADSEQALDLEVVDRLGNQVFGLAFLSGSQRFRVAVSLALGIGQYASRQQRPIESVIIDEGFGCLDREGRQVMIQELQNLRTQLRCILLVSHQEEFADTFAQGYRFDLNNGTTDVTRFQR